MKFKKIILIMLLLMFLTIGAVSASDNLTDEGVLQENPSDVIELSDDAGDVMSAADNGTFAALRNKINSAPSGSTIYLENDYAWDDSDYRPSYDNSIYIGDKILTIEGNGHKIDGMGKSRIFDISSSTVTLNNIQFCNGYASSAGAIEISFSSVSITNSKFISNYANGSGGAINVWYNGGSVKISDCIFQDNYGLYTEGGSISGGDGGAINFRNSVANALSEVTNCEFTSNVAGHGGAIYIDSTYEGGVNIRNCQFTKNKAYYSGGAIDMWDDNELNIYDSVFKQNEYDGIYSWGASVIVHDGVFEDLYGGPVKFVTTPSPTPDQPVAGNSSAGLKTTKLTPKLTAKKATFKVKTKTKKYTAILKTNKNKAMKKVKLYLKVKGKTITAKTNSKGKATFQIKNLKKKGRYSATVTYKGNSKYKKVTKKVQIIVK